MHWIGWNILQKVIFSYSIWSSLCFKQSGWLWPGPAPSDQTDQAYDLIICGGECGVWEAVSLWRAGGGVDPTGETILYPYIQNKHFTFVLNGRFIAQYMYAKDFIVPLFKKKSNQVGFLCTHCTVLTAGHASGTDQGRRRRCACLLHCHRLRHTHPRGRLSYQIQQGRHHCHSQWTQGGQLSLLFQFYWVIQSYTWCLCRWGLIAINIWSVISKNRYRIYVLPLSCFRCVNLMAGTSSWKKLSRVTLPWSKPGKQTKLEISSSGTNVCSSSTADGLEVVFLNPTVSHGWWLVFCPNLKIAPFFHLSVSI